MTEALGGMIGVWSAILAQTLAAGMWLGNLTSQVREHGRRLDGRASDGERLATLEAQLASIAEMARDHRDELRELKDELRERPSRRRKVN